MINTTIDFALTNGETVKLTLNFELLLKIKSKYPNEYDIFSKYVLFGEKSDDLDFFDLIQVIYVAYLCANFEDEKIYSKEAFIKLVPFDMALIRRTQQELLGLKKK